MFKNTQSNEQAIQHKRIVRLMSETSDADHMKTSDVDFPEIEGIIIIIFIYLFTVGV